MATQVGIGPLYRVDGPLPVRPVRGLLQAAEAPAAGVQIKDELDADQVERWLNGIEIYPYPDISWGGVFGTCNTGSDATTKLFGDEVPFHNPQYSAMTVYLAETCASYKVWDQDEFIQRAIRSFEAVEGSIAAREFLTGQVRGPLEPSLADGTGTFPNGNNKTPVGYGLALLEGEISKSGRLGVIHCSPLLATMLMERFAVDDKTGVLRTINGNVVVPDAGYHGGWTPANHTAATGTAEWMFATGPVDVRRTPQIDVFPKEAREALDRGIAGTATSGRPNRYTWRAERYYLLSWDTYVHAAVLADPCMKECGE